LPENKIAYLLAQPRLWTPAGNIDNKSFFPKVPVTRASEQKTDGFGSGLQRSEESVFITGLPV